MPRMITLGAAQTGPVNEDDWRPNVPGACAMIEEAGRRKVDILSFPELFLTPFFPTGSPGTTTSSSSRWTSRSSRRFSRPRSTTA